MFLCTKRYMVGFMLTFPALVYLFLMFAAIGQVCFRTDSDQVNFRDKYLKLLEYFQRQKDLRISGRYLIKNDIIDTGKHLHAPVIDSSSSSYDSKLNDGFSNKNVEYKTSRSDLMYNCSSISLMKIRSKVGHGVSKQAFVADYQGTQVAIKMVTRHIHEVRSCLEQLNRTQLRNRQTPDTSQSYTTTFSQSRHKNQRSSSSVSLNFDGRLGVDTEITPKQMSTDGELSKSWGRMTTKTSSERQRCYTFPTGKLMKEILLSRQLQHYNLARLLGYCVRSEESDSTDISEHGVISVYELGSRFVLDNLQILPWQTRLRHAIEMADLLYYLQYSPLGSLVVPDFKEGHLILINGSLKLIDLDDVNNLEPECDVKDGRGSSCPYNLRCERAMCEGFNAKENLKNMNALVFKRLLFPLTFPQSVIAEIGQLNAKLDSLTLTAGDLVRKLVDIQTFLLKEGT